jgi:hypothetical protein
LKARGVKDRICRRPHKHLTALPHWQLKRNKAIAKRRGAVEQVFGTAKRGFGYVRALDPSRRQPWAGILLCDDVQPAPGRRSGHGMTGGVHPRGS